MKNETLIAGSKILVVDDDPKIRFGIKRSLSEQGCIISEADTCRSAEEIFRTFAPDVAIIDYQLPDGNAFVLLPTLAKIDANVPIVILTGYGSVDIAVQLMREGAEDFITKPVEPDSLLPLIVRLLSKQLARQRREIKSCQHPRNTLDPFIGTSQLIRQLHDLTAKVLMTDRPLLILGETGTGKSTLAKWVHRHSPRADKPFVSLNCAGLKSEFLETELFGHNKGAFTGAAAEKPGLLEVADEGTIFLDEIGDMDLRVQPKVLSFIEERKFRRLGAVESLEVDTRLIIATHQDLRQKVQKGYFRKDLFFRIATLPLTIPPLRERQEDIVILGCCILQRFSAELGSSRLDFSDDAIMALREYFWPGNIRELRNTIERAVLLNLDAKEITSEMLDFEYDQFEESATEEEENLSLVQIERQHIERVLRLKKGNVGQAATVLKIPRSTLYSKLKKYGIRLHLDKS